MILIDAGAKYVVVTDSGETMEFGKAPPSGVKPEGYQKAILEEASRQSVKSLVKPEVLADV